MSRKCWYYKTLGWVEAWIFYSKSKVFATKEWKYVFSRFIDWEVDIFRSPYFTSCLLTTLIYDWKSISYTSQVSFNVWNSFHSMKQKTSFTSLDWKRNWNGGTIVRAEKNHRIFHLLQMACIVRTGRAGEIGLAPVRELSIREATGPLMRQETLFDDYNWTINRTGKITV